VGVEPLGSHSLRKAFISMLVSAGVSFPLVDAMTHNSKTERRIVARYANVVEAVGIEHRAIHLVPTIL